MIEAGFLRFFLSESCPQLVSAAIVGRGMSRPERGQ